MVINENGTRQPIFYVYRLDANNAQQKYIIITTEGNSTIWQYKYDQKNEASTLWANNGGKRPLARPVCDFDGSACPVSFWQANWVYFVVGFVIIFILVLCMLLTLAYALRTRQREQDRQDRLWQIPFVMLTKPKEKNFDKSVRSLQSGISSTSTRLTMDSLKDTNRLVYFYLSSELVVAKKHGIRPTLNKLDYAEFRFMRQVDHENLNKFLGLSYDGPMFLSVWKFCSRGSLRDIIDKGNLTIDAFFMTTIIRDICEVDY
uniref:Guanylate cyclase n=1 Tax=Acrobeloides nanus TaxID=290746 RepID=A0A914E1K6_9BILA